MIASHTKNVPYEVKLFPYEGKTVPLEVKSKRCAVCGPWVGHTPYSIITPCTPNDRLTV